MLNCHLSIFTESQLSILIDMCERSADSDERASCLLCDEKMILRALWTHVALHLEDIVLFVLLMKTDDHNVNANSDHVEQLYEKDNHLDNNKLSSLESFDEDKAVQTSLQDFKAFKITLKTEEKYSLSEVRD